MGAFLSHTTISQENLGVQSNVQVGDGLHLLISSKVMYVMIVVTHFQICQYIAQRAGI